MHCRPFRWNALANDPAGFGLEFDRAGGGRPGFRRSVSVMTNRKASVPAVKTSDVQRNPANGQHAGTLASCCHHADGGGGSRGGRRRRDRLQTEAGWVVGHGIPPE